MLSLEADGDNAESAREVYLHYEALGPDYLDSTVLWIEKAVKFRDEIANSDLFVYYLGDIECDKAKYRLNKLWSEKLIDRQRYDDELIRIENCRNKRN